MASTSFSLGEYWDDFIAQKVEDGRYGSKSEVVREALRLLEAQQKIDEEHVRLALEALADPRPRFELTDDLIDEIKQKARQRALGNDDHDDKAA